MNERKSAADPMDAHHEDIKVASAVCEVDSCDIVEVLEVAPARKCSHTEAVSINKQKSGKIRTIARSYWFGSYVAGH